LFALPHNNEILFPPQFDTGLELTPHSYPMDTAAYRADTVFLIAQNNAKVLFVINIK
jgi:hypothetical protein